MQKPRILERQEVDMASIFLLTVAHVPQWGYGVIGLDLVACRGDIVKR